MSTTRYADLMNGELDGTNTGRESEELHAWLENHPEEKTHFEEMRRIVSAMKTHGDVAPPDGHIERVIGSIPFTRHRDSHYVQESGGWVAWLQGVFARPALRFAGVFGVGLVAGALVWNAVSNRNHGNALDYSLDISEISGTMKTISDTEGFARAGDLNVEVDGVRGSFQLHEHESDGTLLAEVTLHSDAPVEWALGYDSDQVAFEGFRQFAEQGSKLTATDSETRASHEGDGRYLLFFSTRDGASVPMTLRIFSSDKLLFEGNIPDIK